MDAKTSSWIFEEEMYIYIGSKYLPTNYELQRGKYCVFEKSREYHFSLMCHQNATHLTKDSHMPPKVPRWA